MEYLVIAEHLIVLLTIGGFLFWQFCRSPKANAWPPPLGVIVILLLACPYIPFLIDLKTKPERASLSLLGWAKLNGTIIEMIAYGQHATRINQNWFYRWQLHVAMGIVIIAIMSQAACVGISIRLTTLSPLQRTVMAHLSGAILNFLIAAGWLWAWYRLRAHFWLFYSLTFVYLLAAGCRIGFMWVQDERWAFLGECTLQSVILLRLALHPLFRPPQDAAEICSSRHSPKKRILSSTARDLEAFPKTSFQLAPVQPTAT